MLCVTALSGVIYLAMTAANVTTVDWLTSACKSMPHGCAWFVVILGFNIVFMLAYGIVELVVWLWDAGSGFFTTGHSIYATALLEKAYGTSPYFDGPLGDHQFLVVQSDATHKLPTVIGCGARVRSPSGLGIYLYVPNHVVEGLDGQVYAARRGERDLILVPLVDGLRVEDQDMRFYKDFSSADLQKLGNLQAGSPRPVPKSMFVSVTGPTKTQNTSSGPVRAQSIMGLLTYEGSTRPGFSGATYRVANSIYGYHLYASSAGNGGYAAMFVEAFYQRAMGYHAQSTDDVVRNLKIARKVVGYDDYFMLDMGDNKYHWVDKEDFFDALDETGFSLDNEGNVVKNVENRTVKFQSDDRLDSLQVVMASLATLQQQIQLLSDQLERQAKLTADLPGRVKQLEMRPLPCESGNGLTAGCGVPPVLAPTSTPPTPTIPPTAFTPIGKQALDGPEMTPSQSSPVSTDIHVDVERPVSPPLPPSKSTSRPSQLTTAITNGHPVRFHPVAGMTTKSLKQWRDATARVLRAWAPINICPTWKASLHLMSTAELCEMRDSIALLLGYEKGFGLRWPEALSCPLGVTQSPMV